MDRPTWLARGRLAALWLSQVARVTADNCLRIFVVLALAQAGAAERDAAWHLTGALLALPAIFLSPVNGALSNSLPRRWVLAGSTALSLAAVVLVGLLGGHWLACWALVAACWVVYSPTRYALLPAAATDTHLPLTRINAWIESGAVCAILAGMLLGGWLSSFAAPAPPALVATLLLHAIAIAAALPVVFAADVRRPEALTAALAGFFRDVGRIARVPAARASLAGLAVLRGLVAAGTGAVVAAALERGAAEGEAFVALVWVGLWILAGIAVGSFLAGLQGHLSRSLGLVPLGGAGLAVGLAAAALESAASVPAWVCVLVGVMGGLTNVPLAANYQASVPADARGNAMAVRNTVEYLLISAAALLMSTLALTQTVTPTGQLWLTAVLTAIAAAAAVRPLLRPCLEQLTQLLLWPFYRVHTSGPGLESFPPQGPVVVIANHTAWLDPMWISIAIPRPLLPMMTAAFYDLPGIHWIVSRVVGAIRVPEEHFRREAPELAEAVAVLDRGECLLVFPEGRLRRRAEPTLRNFGQGVWHILHQRPTTPVVVCWIEGAWGTYTSYCGGPPTVNKRPDLWHRIDIVVGAPQVLDAKLLDDQRATRAYLRQVCRDLRSHLGLATPPSESSAENDDPA